MTLVAALRNPVSRWSSETPFAAPGSPCTSYWRCWVRGTAFHRRRRRRLSHAGTAAQTKTTALRFTGLFPPLGTLDELISRSLGAGFVFITTSIIIGIVWAYIEHGASWIGNGLISSASITWGIYLALIFFRVSAGWRGRKAAILAIVALCCSAIAWIAHAQLERRLIQ